MPENLMYDATNEKIWFPFPEHKEGKIDFNTITFSSDGGGYRTYTDVVMYEESRENCTDGYVIPSQLFRDLKLSGNRPSKQLRRLIFDLIPSYGSLDERYGVTLSPIQALEEKKGGCQHRTSIGAAIAEANGIPYRTVCSDNLAPDIDSMKGLFYNYLEIQLGCLQMIKMPRYALFPPRAMFEPVYPHNWLEVYEDGDWVTVDTVEWNPVDFLPFKKRAKERFVGKTIIGKTINL